VKSYEIIYINSMGISGSQNGGTVPYKAIFCGDIPLHRTYIGLGIPELLTIGLMEVKTTKMLEFPSNPFFKMGWQGENHQEKCDDLP
jgi:hypothetical protein